MHLQNSAEKLWQKSKRPIIWFVVYAALLQGMNWLLPQMITTTDLIYLAILSGGITFLAHLAGALIDEKRFNVTKDFFFWWPVNAWTIWFGGFVLSKMDVGSGWQSTILVAIGIIIVHAVFRAVWPTDSTKTITAILMIVMILFIPVGEMVNGSFEVSTKISNPVKSLGNFFEGLKSVFSNCPQLNVPLETASTNYDGIQKAIFVSSDKYDEWSIKKKHMSEMTLPLYYSVAGVPCVKGNAQGQNMNYWYCGHMISSGIMGFQKSSDWPYMEKTVIHADGTIGETIRKGFRNTYDQNGEFIETICLADPVAQDEKSLNELANWMMNN